MANPYMKSSAILSSMLREFRKTNRKLKRKHAIQASEIRRLINRKNNTYYIMSRDSASDSKFTVTTGINGSKAKPDVKQHPMAQWDLLYKIKTKTQKYEDISDIYEGNYEDPVEETVQAIDNIKNEDGIPASIIALLRELKEAADTKSKEGKMPLSMAADITPKNIAIAQEILNELASMADNIPEDDAAKFIDIFNASLSKILIAFPRKDKKWNSLVLKCTDKQLAKNPEKVLGKKIAEIISREQVVLDELYAETLAYIDEYQKVKNTLESLQIKILEADSKLINFVQQQTGLSKFKCWYIINAKTKKNYEANKSSVSGIHKNEELLFHGSPTFNWLSILCRGLKLTDYVENGRLLGHGLYFGPFSTTGSYGRGKGFHGYNGIFRVRVGNKSKSTDPTNKKELAAKGYDCHYAGWATVIYDENQADIYALVQIS